jgi:hypothetical protein
MAATILFSSSSTLQAAADVATDREEYEHDQTGADQHLILDQTLGVVQQQSFILRAPDKENRRREQMSITASFRDS